MKKSSSNINTRRRELLKVIATSGIARGVIATSPLLSGIMLSRQAEAQSVSQPDKSLVIYIPGGGIHSMWAPSGEGTDMTMGAMSSGYDSVKTECNFLLNMSHGNAGHGVMPLILSDRWGGDNSDSYDVFMGRQLGPDRAFAYVNLGIHSNGQGYITRDNGSSIPFQDNPFNAFNLLFGSNVSSSPKTPILDAHAQGLVGIKNKLANYEVERLDQHLDAISDTQRRLDELEGVASCPTAPNSTEFGLSYDTFSQQAKLQADIAVAALSCGLTSSVSIAFGNHQGEFRIPELNYTGNYHQSIHGGSNGLPNYPYYVEMRNHMGSLTAYAIAKLEQAGIINSTVVVETTDMGHADLHSGSDVPMMIAGGGEAIHRGTSTSTGGSYNHLDMLYTAAKATGVTLSYGQEIPGVLA